MFDALQRTDPFLAGGYILIALAATVYVLYAGFAWLNDWLEARAENLLQSWAARSGYELLKHERKMECGPFSALTTWAQVIYFVTVADERGHTRRAWLRCGRMLTGVLSNKVQVHWEE